MGRGCVFSSIQPTYRAHLQVKPVPSPWPDLESKDLGGAPHPVIVTVRNKGLGFRAQRWLAGIMAMILGSSYMPSIPLLQGGGSI